MKSDRWREAGAGSLLRGWLLLTGLLLGGEVTRADSSVGLLARPGAYPELTEPPCSYCANENRKGFVQPEDRVIAWIRAVHNGGAIPLRHFLARTRIINDTYGLFFHDTDGGYVSAFRKDYGYTFHGWRRGLMVARGPDGTLWSCLSGRGIEGPRKGERLQRIPAFLTQWGYWLMLHPESTAYNLFDGRRYEPADWPTELSEGARQTLGEVDQRLPALANVMGVESENGARAFPLDGLPERACFTARIGEDACAVFWYGPTQSAVAFRSRHEGRDLTFYADDISPETAPFKDRETGTRWTLAGRGVDGPLRGHELTWAPSVQCRWYAWSAEFPETEVHAAEASTDRRGP